MKNRAHVVCWLALDDDINNYREHLTIIVVGRFLERCQAISRVRAVTKYGELVRLISLLGRAASARARCGRRSIYRSVLSSEWTRDCRRDGGRREVRRRRLLDVDASSHGRHRVNDIVARLVALYHGQPPSPIHLWILPFVEASHSSDLIRRAHITTSQYCSASVCLDKARKRANRRSCEAFELRRAHALTLLHTTLSCC